MTTSLDRLAEIVRQAEAKSRAQRIHIEIDNAKQQLHSAEERTRIADARLRDVRPVRLRELEQAETEDLQLKDLVKKMAQVKSQLDTDNRPEDLIADAQAEIVVKRRLAQAELEEVTHEAEESKRELRVALDQYQQLRRDLDRLQPHLVASLSAEDRLVAESEMYFPSGQLQALSKEVDDGLNHFGSLESKEQYAQLKIWIGRYRRLQTQTLSEEEQLISRRIFGKLVGLSKEYEPGYIEAFQINFTTDWDAFIAEAQEQLRQGTESVRRKREMERQYVDQQLRDQERMRMAQESAQTALEELKGLLVRYHLPNEGAEEFRDTLSKVVSGYGASHPKVLELVMPYRDLVDSWSEFRALRRNLDRMRQEECKDDETLQENYEDLLAQTRGMRVVMIGGVAREDVRRALERIFDFDELDWETYEDTKPAVLESLETRVRNHGMDLVLILKSFIRHHVPEKLRPLCEQFSIPCLMVEHGYGPAQIAEVLRRGLLKTV